ncbi:uncharacterized protein TM35_000063880 [Trypanosoma theileri]|uniref:Rieske domain-containing protein n=1 Tax=Trypanosoma theileri TaxID=67003 RepID=A0A1X0P3Z4_9TRYP|nr:uncharacterized protein TM35_000063880 [Trypanosoma theileri]ORC91383.1 hypothetical protein TM35_000063880 [Trypanosoma theileri]
MSNQHMYDGWSYERLRQQRNRAHFLLEDPYRFVTVLLHNDRLYAIDSPCYHSSGPLGEGEVMDIEDTFSAGKVACLRCPWHNFLVSIETGEEIEVEPIVTSDKSKGDGNVHSGGDNAVQEMEMPTYPLRPHWETTTATTSGSGSGGGGGLRVTRGIVVQRTHKVWLDESTGILTIEVEDEKAMRRRPVASDRVAGDLQSGALTMQVFDIKRRKQDE